MPTTRQIRTEDAEELATLLRENRDFLAPYEPLRQDEYFTAGGQRADVATGSRRLPAGAAPRRPRWRA